jgi:hypothetical protein
MPAERQAEIAFAENSMMPAADLTQLIPSAIRQHPVWRDETEPDLAVRWSPQTPSARCQNTPVPDRAGLGPVSLARGPRAHLAGKRAG